MKYVKSNSKDGNVISTKRSDYQVLLDIILKHTDIVCFTASPYLDSIDELREDIRYKKIIDSYIDSEYKKSIHTENCNEYLVYFKLDYYVREFLKEKKDIFDFYDEDANINLEDIVFIGKNGIVCDTITHEQYCWLSDDLLHEIKIKKGIND